jgi:hypothetical protein
MAPKRLFPVVGHRPLSESVRRNIALKG